MKTKAFLAVFGAFLLLGTAQAQTLYQGNGQSSNNTYYNRGAAPLNLKALQRQPTSANRYGGTSGQQSADPLLTYRAQRDAEAQAAYGQQVNNLVTMNNQSAGQYLQNYGAQNYTRGAPNTTAPSGRMIYRKKDSKPDKPKKVFNSVR